VVCGDCNVRINPGSGINLNKTECWVVGPPVSSSLHARSHVDFHDAAVSAMPRLLDEVERLRKEVQSWTDEAARYCENSVYWQDKYEVNRGLRTEIERLRKENAKVIAENDLMLAFVRKVESDYAGSLNLQIEADEILGKVLND